MSSKSVFKTELVKLKIIIAFAYKNPYTTYTLNAGFPKPPNRLLLVKCGAHKIFYKINKTITLWLVLNKLG